MSVRFDVADYLDLFVAVPRPESRRKFKKFCRKLLDGDVVEAFTLGDLTIGEEGSSVSFSTSIMELTTPRLYCVKLLEELPKAWD